MLTRRNFLLGGIVPIVASRNLFTASVSAQASNVVTFGEDEKAAAHIETDLIVIHHTQAPQGLSWKELSEIQRGTVYAPVYRAKKAGPPHSNHQREIAPDRMVEVFYCYHWIIRQNGRADRLLEDHYVAWHSGNGHENLRSIALSFDGNFDRIPHPSQAAIETCAKLISDYASRLPIGRLKGHSEIHAGRTCPGHWFEQKQTDGLTGREKLLDLTGLELTR